MVKEQISTQVATSINDRARPKTALQTAFWFLPAARRQPPRGLNRILKESVTRESLSRAYAFLFLYQEMKYEGGCFAAIAASSELRFAASPTERPMLHTWSAANHPSLLLKACSMISIRYEILSHMPTAVFPQAAFLSH